MRFSTRPIFGAAVAVGTLLLVGCGKNSAPGVADAAKPEKASVELVKESERSRHFAAVNRQLELGGTLYGYADIDGDVAKLLGGAQQLLAEIAKTQPQVAPFAQKDLAAIGQTLGLIDVKAIGVSSVPDGTGYFRNRAFFYTGGERHGLLAGLGGKPGPFTHLHYAPADTALYAEADIDVPEVYRAIKTVVGQIAGEPVGTQLEAALKKAGEQATLSVLDLVYGLKGHSSLVLRVDAAKPMRIPSAQPITIPGVSLLLSVDGIAPVIESSLAKSLKRSDQGAWHVYEFPVQSPVAGLQPVVVVDGTTVHLASSLAFFRECVEQKNGLAENAEYKSAVAALGGEGNGLVFISPKLFTELRQIETLNPNLPPEPKAVLKLVLNKIPQGSRPLIALRSNIPDGILVRSYWDRSLKQEVAMIGVYNPVTVGLMAAMAIPAFQKVRSASQEKAILNNLRMLAAAAEQYYLENGTRMASYDQIVGPGKYVTVLQSVAGENYRTLRFVQGQPLRVQLPDGRVIQYPPATPQPVRQPQRR
jgi:type IV pilus assembly protein PilA